MRCRYDGYTAARLIAWAVCELDFGASLTEVIEATGLAKVVVRRWEAIFTGMSWGSIVSLYGKLVADKCRVCKKFFIPQLGHGFLICYSCRTLKNFCRCGCGKVLLDPKRRYVAGHWFKGKKLSEETKKKMSVRAKGLVRSEESRERCSKGAIIRWSSSKERLAQSKRTSACWDSLTSLERDVWLRAIRKGADTSPNTKEVRLDGLLKKFFPGEFKINVSGDVVIGGKIPDFVNVNGKKVLVELFGNYWHGEEKTGRTMGEEEERRKKIFSDWGFKTAIVWEKDLKSPALVRDKVLRVIGDGK